MRDPLRFRFRATITGEGAIVLPGDAARKLGPGTAVAVTVTAGVPESAGMVDEEEVAAIAAIQAEPAELVRKCLLAQGAFTPRPGSR